MATAYAANDVGIDVTVDDNGVNVVAAGAYLVELCSSLAAVAAASMSALSSCRWSVTVLYFPPCHCTVLLSMSLYCTALHFHVYVYDFTSKISLN